MDWASWGVLLRPSIVIVPLEVTVTLPGVPSAPSLTFVHCLPRMRFTCRPEPMPAGPLIAWDPAPPPPLIDWAWMPKA